MIRIFVGFITFGIGFALGIYSVASPIRLDAPVSNPYPKSCMTSFLVNSLTEEVILIAKEKEHRIEILHVPRPTTPDWTLCYGPTCLPLSDVVTYIITKERQ